MGERRSKKENMKPYLISVSTAGLREWINYHHLCYYRYHFWLTYIELGQ